MATKGAPRAARCSDLQAAFGESRILEVEIGVVNGVLTTDCRPIKDLAFSVEERVDREKVRSS